MFLFCLAGEGLFPRPHPERSFNVTHWFIYDLPVFFRKGRRVTLHRPVSETIVELTLSLSFLCVFLCGIPDKGKCSCFCRSVVRASPHRQCRLIVALYDALLLPVSQSPFRDTVGKGNCPFVVLPPVHLAMSAYYSLCRISLYCGLYAGCGAFFSVG